MMRSRSPAAIRRWLLTSGIQVTSGPEEGGIGGWLGAGALPEFVYTEVTGYYLTASAFMREILPSRCIGEENTRRAFAWISRTCQGGDAPPTRRYLDGQHSDWKCHARFAFDLAVTLRGIAATATKIASPAEAIRTRKTLVKALLQFCGPYDGFVPVVQDKCLHPVPIPSRWSTSPGPYQLKIAASLLLSLNGDTPVEIDRACRRIRSQWCADLRGHAVTGEAHADLYFIEGLILLALQNNDEHAWNLAALNYNALVESVCGNSPASTAARSDVIAQILRAGCILRSRGRLSQPHWPATLDRYASRMKQFINGEGAVSFQLADNNGRVHWNAWCALFAYQALCFHEVISKEHCLPDRWIELLI